MNTTVTPESYRFPNETLILTVTLVLVFLVIALTATATLCTSVVFLALFVGLAYFSTRSQHQALLERGRRVSDLGTPNLAILARHCLRRLQPGNVEIYVVRSRQINAYTFGISDPKVVVLYSPLFQIMDEDELCFVLGHELGHVALGHTRINSLLGGLAGIPSPFTASALLNLAFLAWNRACEHSADRAGLLACGKPNKAISALIKLSAGPHALKPGGMEQAYRQIDAEDDTLLGNLSEALGTHPMLIRRINEIRKYARSAAYKRLVSEERRFSGSRGAPVRS